MEAKQRSGFHEPEPSPRSRQDAPLLHPEEFSKILRLAPLNHEQQTFDPDLQREHDTLHEPTRDTTRERILVRRGTLTARDVAGAMELVHAAASSIRAAEERVRDGEARAQALLKQATEDLKSAEARVQSAEARTQAAEARAQAAEARCRTAEGRIEASETRTEEAENWLRQIYSAISEELPTRT